MKYTYGTVDTVGFFFVTYFLLFLGFLFAMGLVRGILNNKVGMYYLKNGELPICMRSDRTYIEYNDIGAKTPISEINYKEKTSYYDVIDLFN